MRHIKTNRKMADINPATSIIILSMNALKTPIKRHNHQSRLEKATFNYMCCNGHSLYSDIDGWGLKDGKRYTRRELKYLSWKGNRKVLFKNQYL